MSITRDKLPLGHPARDVLAKFNRHFFAEGKERAYIGVNEWRAIALALTPPPPSAGSVAAQNDRAMSKCTACDGTGLTHRGERFANVDTECVTCSGTGRTPSQNGQSVSSALARLVVIASHGEGSAPIRWDYAAALTSEWDRRIIEREQLRRMLREAECPVADEWSAAAQACPWCAKRRELVGD